MGIKSILTQNRRLLNKNKIKTNKLKDLRIFTGKISGSPVNLIKEEAAGRKSKEMRVERRKIRILIIFLKKHYILQKKKKIDHRYF